jgi:hypothetical protein
VAQVHVALPPKVEWQKLLEAGGNKYVFGKKGDSLLIYSINKKEIITVLNNKKSYSSTLSVKNILAFRGETAAVFYDYAGNKLNEVNLTKAQNIVGVSYSKQLEEYFYVYTDMGGLGRDGVTHANISRIEEPDPFVTVNYQQDPLPGLIVSPIMTVTDKVFITFKKKYIIEAYSLKGKKLFDITNENFKPLPYTREEVDYLAEQGNYFVEEGKSYPIAIAQLHGNNENELCVFRKMRPLSDTLYVDIFSGETVAFKKTFSHIFPAGHRFVDGTVNKEDITCLIHNIKAKEYYINNIEKK